MINTILISLFYTTFICERCYHYIYNNKKEQEDILNFNQSLSQPLNIKENIKYPITDNNTLITEYTMNQPANPHF